MKIMAICAALVFGVTTGIQAQSSFKVVARDSSATMYEIGEGAYAIIHADAIHDYPSGATEWPHGNTGVVVGENGVLVIDSNLFPSRAAADIQLIRNVTNIPVRYLVNTHWHGDHTHGNGAYASIFPDIVILGAAENREFIKLNQARYPKSVLALSSTARKTLDRHETLLGRGADSTGQPLSAAQKALLRQVIGELKTQLVEFGEVRVAPPTLLFGDSLVLDLGNRTVHLKNWGRANSPADVTAYVTDLRILFTGDILVHPVPYVFGAYPAPWVPVLKSIERIPITAMVPGHGPVMTNHNFTTTVRELFEATASRMQALLEQGKTYAEVQREIDLTDFMPKFVAPNDSAARLYWDESIIGGLIERTYQCLMGNRC